MLYTKYKNFRNYLEDVRDRLIHIEAKIDTLCGYTDNGAEDEKVEELEAVLPRKKGVFSMALLEGGGVGDAILDTQLLKTIAMLSSKEIRIDFYCRSYKQFRRYPFISNAYSCLNKIDKKNYDLVLIGHRFMIVDYMNEAAVRRYSPLLLEYCHDCKRLIEEDMANILNDNLITQYALLKNKRRIEQCNINNILPLTRYTSKYMSLADSEFSVLSEYGLVGKRYLVINRAVDEKYGNDHPKLWPLDRYNKLVKKIKGNYPDILLVLLGDSAKFEAVSLVDVNLIGKTSLEQCKVLLKHSVGLIAGEGGLVHMKNFLYGKSVVIYGPTLPEIFGYDENYNIRGEGCKRTCEWVTDKWADGCILDYDEPKCIYSVTVDAVYDAVCKMIDAYKEIGGCCIECRECVGTFDVSEYLEEKNQKVCMIGKTKESDDLVSSERIQTMDIFVENIKPQERAHFIKEEYGNIYNIPSYDCFYDLVVCSMDEKIDYYFAIKELLRVVRKGGKIILPVKKKNLSLAKDAMERLKVYAENLKICYEKDMLFVLRRE